MSRNMKIIKKIMSFFIKKTAWYNEQIFMDCKKFWFIDNYNLDIINLGSNSAKYGFNYTKQNIHAANWAMGPQSLYIDLLILQCYYSYLKQGATVLITLCPFSCLVGYDYSYLNDKYYTVLHHSQFPCFNIHKRKEMIDIKNNPYKYIPLYQIFREFYRIFNNLFVRDKISLTNIEMEQDAERFMLSWKSQFFLKNLDDDYSLLNKNSFEESKEILHNIVDFCNRYGFKPVVVMPPVSTSLKKYFSQKVLCKNIDRFVEEAIGNSAPFYNFWNDKRFANNSYFKNSYFLNQKGAYLFTSLVIEKLKLI